MEKAVFSYICIEKLAYKYDGPHRNILTKLSIDRILLDKMFIAIIFSENINKLVKIYKLTLYVFCLNSEYWNHLFIRVRDPTYNRSQST